MIISIYTKHEACKLQACWKGSRLPTFSQPPMTLPTPCLLSHPTAFFMQHWKEQGMKPMHLQLAYSNHLHRAHLMLLLIHSPTFSTVTPQPIFIIYFIFCLQWTCELPVCAFQHSRLTNSPNRLQVSTTLSCLVSYI